MLVPWGLERHMDETNVLILVIQRASKVTGLGVMGSTEACGSAQCCDLCLRRKRVGSKAKATAKALEATGFDLCLIGAVLQSTTR
ncbi:hypothetical protein CFP56_001020 [Quercus suber]|uniref:Uncharacterized protein n=1 Tax=Quercus suber TaxID=58331 RepID=A0AAW0LGG2_QUESU